MIIHARVAPKRDTTENWEEHPDFIPLTGELIIYTDYHITHDDNGDPVYVPGIKIGDGVTTIGELPFTNAVPVMPEQYVSNIEYDSTNKKITKTIGEETIDVVSVSNIKSDLGAFTWGDLSGQ